MRQRPVGFIPQAQRPGNFSVLWRTMRSVGALMVREMTTTYGRSAGGYIWALLEPMGSVIMITLVIGSGLKLGKPSLGVSFAMFYATGILAFTMYGRMQSKIAQSLIYSRSLLQYPAVKYFDTIVARFLLNLITQCAVIAIVFALIMATVETRTNINLQWIVLSLSMTAAFALGLGVLNAVLMPLFPIYASIFGILTTPLFFLSGVIYLYEDVPQFGQEILWYNPLMHVTAMMRKGFYSQYEAEFVSPLYVFGVSLVLLVLGYIFVSRYHRTIIDRNG